MYALKHTVKLFFLAPSEASSALGSDEVNVIEGKAFECSFLFVHKVYISVSLYTMKVVFEMNKWVVKSVTCAIIGNIYIYICMYIYI